MVLHHKDDNGQNLAVVPVSLQSGQKGAAKLVMSRAPARDRRPGVSVSPDGSAAAGIPLPHQQPAGEEHCGHAIRPERDGKLEEKTYDFRTLSDFFSPAVHVANDGTQYVTLISEGMKKLTVRRYPAGPSSEIKVLGVPVGGVFGGRAVTVRDAQVHGAERWQLVCRCAVRRLRRPVNTTA